MKQIPLTEDARADTEPAEHARTHIVTSDLAYQRLGIVNVVYYGRHDQAEGGWVLIDAGLPHTSKLIKRAVAERFGEDARPMAIIMTHAHADHAGSLEDLAEEWQVPIYAHPLELPYLDGTAAYPPPDPSVGGGAMPAMSVLFPRGPFNVSRYLKPLPADHSVPGMPGWEWIHTPGHTPGHVSFWRESDRALIAGDAVITTNQESVYAVLLQKTEMHGPPSYYTQNWIDAEKSVRRLADLSPEILITGHGHAMEGRQMRAALQSLSENFKQVAVPAKGKYVAHPTSANDGTAYQTR